MAEMASKTAVLVHGGFHGGWCWQRVAGPLRAAGWNVYTPTLTGLADRAHLATRDVGLQTHVQDVVGLIEAEELEDIVLLGHSAGGMTITAAADRIPGRIGALLYLDASLPADGQSMLDFMGDTQGVPGLFRGQAAESGDGWMIPAGKPFDAEGFGVEDPADREWVDRRMTDHPLKAFEDKVALTGAWESVARRTYVRCEGFQVAHGEPTVAGCEADPAWQTERWDCGHHPGVTHPEWVAGAVSALA